jgi:hypothetical protein
MAVSCCDVAEGASPRWGEPGTIAHGIGVLLGRQVILVDAQFAEDRPDIAEGGDQVLQPECAQDLVDHRGVSNLGLVLGLLHAGAAAALDRLGVTREKVREASARLFQPTMIAGEDGQERRVVGDGEAEQAVTGARRLAARREQSQFRTEHLLFCIALDPGSAARRILGGLDVDPARIKKELDEWIAPVQRRHRRIGKARGTTRACSFCGCKDLGPLVAGPGVWICGSCAQTAIEILRAEPRGLRAG